ncbi:MAG: hypothetical protein JOZ42_11975, partial [Acetobacteraceae bacterium]|nr:hypothetical protein [Acetobacteraceae bacterium]
MASAAERQICTNFWAYRHWLRATGGAAIGTLDEWRAWARAEPARCAASVRAFAGLPERPSRLLVRPAPGGALVLREGGGRQSWPAERLAGGELNGLPAAWSAIFAAVHAPEALTAAASLLLLQADLRPDDRVVLASEAAWPWAYALREGAVLVAASAHTTEILKQIVEGENATIL